jgi:peptidoglycan/xylan/chitin deacetylase (PgdA/CDA1 family)
MKSLSPHLHTLLYHRVCADNEWYPSPYVVAASSFRRQMTYLHRQGYYTPSLNEVLAGGLASSTRRGKAFLLTFDDGYLDNYEYAFPVLQEFGFTATIFLVADLSRRENWWDLPDGVPRALLLRSKHIREMSAHGIEFGSHTLTHPRLTTLSPPALQYELTKSREVIQQIVQKHVPAFSYPYSDLNNTVRQCVADVGYQCAFAVNTGPWYIGADLFQIRRLNVENGAGPLSMRAKMSGAEKALLYTWWRGKQIIASLGTRSNVPELRNQQ